MCTDCFDEDEDDSGIAPEEITRLARHIEAEMSGPPLTPRIWAVYLGEASGALDWKSLERIGRALEGARLVAAIAHMPRPTEGRGR
ncbi:hypothetical protein [Ancylobacter sp. SL191]|uniref:hypothetical protein n=1 Tax=Ancylobacter sp. SL191 TaxID=2995166 RepID=UPI0022703EA1|nr:hypothetical protein [Ancylobacter sp. SL191]WAC29393.1 hypothetical protein OU996_10365 [Ancylobacter sp. SL191]